MSWLKVWVKVSGRLNGTIEELIELPDDWDERSDSEKRDHAEQAWEEFRDSVANGGFCLVHEDNTIEDL